MFSLRCRPALKTRADGENFTIKYLCIFDGLKETAAYFYVSLDTGSDNGNSKKIIEIILW